MQQTASSFVETAAPARSRAGWPAALLLLCLGLQLGAFAIDLMLPLGISISILYVAALLAGLWLPWRWAMPALALLSTGLTILGYFLSPPGPLATAWSPVVNRSISIATLWAVTFLTWRHLGDMAALRRIRARLRDAQRIAHFGHFEIDPADGNSYWCEQCLATLGLDRSFRHMSVRRFVEGCVHPDDRARVDAALRDAMRDGTRFGIEFRIVRPAGDLRHVRSEGALFRDDAKAALLIGALLDVSERRAAEEALRRSEEHFRVAQDLSLDGFMILRAVRGADGDISDFEWDYANPTAHRLLRAEGEDLKGQRLLARLPGNKGRSRLFQHYVRVVETGEPHDLEFFYDGEGIAGWFRNMAVKLGDGVAVSFTDITERKRTDIALRGQEARLRSILETAPEALITIDEHGLIESFSRSAEILFGYAADEVVGRNVSLLMPSPYREEHDGYLARYLRTGEKRIIGIGRVVQAQRKDGAAFPIELAVGEANVGGRRLFTGFIRDLTAKERMEQELRQAQKMEAVGQLTGGIAHDFNNLLTVILGNLELLEMRLDGDERQRALLREAQETAQLGAQLTERLLAFGRRQPLQPRLTDVGQLIQELSVLIRRTLGEAIEVRLSIAPRLQKTLVDPGQLQNALLNLAINARDAMPNGGTLTIEAANAELDADYAQMHSEVRPGHYVVIAVSDTGSGMSPAVQERAFEPFFTTKAAGAGTGLGLSMVYGFVKQSDGHVQLYSEIGHGTTVRLYLPRAEAPEAQAEREAASEPAMPRAKGETVLVVEDDQRVRRVSVARLLDLGYRVLEAENGPAALALLGRHPEVAVLFTDVVMPGGMSGGDLAREARARRPDLKILFTSGYAQPEILRKGLIEQSRWLKKPYTAADLARTLREILD